MNSNTDFADKYKTYLNSSSWRIKKREWVSSGRPQFCFICELPMPPNQKGFNFHHRTYKNLFQEKMDDLILLCQDHHKSLEIEYKPLKNVIPLWDWTYMFISQERIRIGKKPTSKSQIARYLPKGEFND